MKKYFILMSAALVALTACDNEALTEEQVLNPAEPQTVVLTFSPYDMEAMTTRASGSVGSGFAAARAQTRAATSITTIVTRLDVWLYADGHEEQAVHQTSSDADFGTLALTLDKRQTYTLYAVAHRDAEPAQLTGGVVSWQSGKTTHTLFYTQTFSPADVTTLDCQMDRIVGQFSLKTTDALPATAQSITISVDDAPMQWNVAGYGTTKSSQSENRARSADNTYEIYTFPYMSSTGTLKITASAITQDGTVIQQRVFENVPATRNRITTYRGAFFSGDAGEITQSGFIFTVNGDWDGEDEHEF